VPELKQIPIADLQPDPNQPRKEFDEVFGRVIDAKIEYGDDFHSVGNMRGPGDETSESLKSAGGGARGPGKNLYFFDPSRHLLEIRHYEG